jgi:site-specific DNA-methyltransferase (adenine-specific)
MMDTVIFGDCLEVLPSIGSGTADLVYLDPPFFTRRDQIQTTRDGAKTFRFSDTWDSKDAYASFLRERMRQICRILKPTGSVFFHCDRNATHLARLILEEIFGPNNFRSEIIWYYRRWANGQDKLLPAHQTILFFSKTAHYKFNKIWADYSPATNLDQIWQRRVRDHRNKTVYAKDASGIVLSNGAKKGVPLGDVWDIPYLNPKARERTGYPTQKPILLLERIIELVTEPGDLVVDPFCGSGTTLVAAKLLKRHFFGVDSSEDATALTRQRLDEPIRSYSGVFEDGRESYEKQDTFVESALAGIDVLPVQRNSGIDAFLKTGNGQGLVPLRVQRPHESLLDAMDAVHSAALKKGCSPMIVVQTHDEASLGIDYGMPEDVLVVSTPTHAIQRQLKDWQKQRTDLTTGPTVRETRRRVSCR